MDRKEFIGLALSPLLLPLTKLNGEPEDKPNIGKFTVRKFKELKAPPIYGDTPLGAYDMNPHYGYTHTEMMLTVTYGKWVVLRKSIEQQSNHFNKNRCKGELKKWAKEYHHELNIIYR